ncbi:MAG: hypothetical protein DMG68_15560 [Acidobacteria bacterium]|nr:MAG: hypothetical protein DMG68_15560 [Acidobacteriota bacterium]
MCHNPQHDGGTLAMDDTPKAFVEELRSSVLKKRVGQIALAVVLAQEVIRFLNSLVWYLIIPIIGRTLEGHTESVLFQTATLRPIPYESLFGAFLELFLAAIAVFYINRWIQRKPRIETIEDTSIDAEMTPQIEEPAK